MYKELSKNKNFILLTTGGFISSIGDYLYNIALTLSLYASTKSIGSIALMWLARAALRIPVQYIAGIITDKYNKKKIIISTNLISVVIAFLFIFITEKRLWIAYILAFLLQSLNDIDENSETAILPELVEKHTLSYANSVFSILQSISIFTAPAIAGVIYKLYGSNVLFIINGLSFLFAGILFTAIRYKAKDPSSSKSSAGIIKSGKEGYKVLSKYPVIKTIFIIVGAYAILGRFYETYKVAVADILLNINADGIIYFDYALALGGIFLPFTIKRLSKYKQNLVFIITSITLSLTYLSFGYSTSFILTFIGLIILGITQGIQDIYLRTMIQKNIPSEYIGRVFSFYKIILTLFAIFGILISTPLYNSLGIGKPFLLIVLLSLILCIRGLFKLKLV